MGIQWFLTPVRRPDAGVRLFCLPHAGAPAAVYRDWGRALPAWIEAHGVQLAGRGWRLSEPPSADLAEMASDVAREILAHGRAPVALFGHSMGAWLGLEVARHLEAAGAEPIGLFASVRQAPSLGNTHAPLGHLDADGFLSRIQALYGGIPPEIMADRDMLELVLPAVRADVRALEGHRHEPEPRLSCPLIAFGGRSDPLVPPEHLRPWSEETLGPFALQTFEGGHFYLDERPTAVLAALTGWIEVLGEARAEPMRAVGGV